MNAIPKFECSYSESICELYVYSSNNFIKRFYWFLNTYHSELRDYLTIKNHNTMISFNHFGFNVPNIAHEVEMLFDEFVQDYDSYNEKFIDDEIETSIKSSAPYPDVKQVTFTRCMVLTQYDDLVTFVIQPEYKHLLDHMEMLFPYVLETKIEPYFKNEKYLYVQVTLDVLWTKARFMYFNELHLLIDKFLKNDGSFDMSIWEDVLEEILGEN